MWALRNPRTARRALPWSRWICPPGWIVIPRRATRAIPLKCVNYEESNRRSFDSLRSLRMTIKAGGCRLMRGLRRQGPALQLLGFCYTGRSALRGKTRQAAPQRYALQPKFGEWLSLVEHLVRDQGVGGSNPLSPTNKINSLQPFYPD